MSNTKVAAILRRLDDHAYEQLCAEVARLAEENDRLRAELIKMESCADGWREDAMSLHEQLAEACDGNRGITMAGQLVVTGGTDSPAAQGAHPQ